MGNANDVTLAVRTAMDNAFEFCAQKTNLKNRDQVLEARLRGDCDVCEYLRYGFAKGIAEYLGSTDPNTKAVYLYDDVGNLIFPNKDIPDHPNLSPGIRMIVWASSKSAALSSLVGALVYSVDKVSRQYPCPNATALCHQLDLTVVDDHEVQERHGYGALVTSLYLRPIEIWHE